MSAAGAPAVVLMTQALALAGILGQPPARGRPPDFMMLEAPNTRTIEKGDQSNVDEAKQVLVRTDGEWTRLWQQHSPERPRPAVDFSNHGLP